MSEFMRVELGIKKELHHLAPLVLIYWISEPVLVSAPIYKLFAKFLPVIQKLKQHHYGKDLWDHPLRQ